METSRRTPKKAFAPWAVCIVSCALGIPTAALAEPLKFETFERDLVPFVTRHCVKCHNEQEADAHHHVYVCQLTDESLLREPRR